MILYITHEIPLYLTVKFFFLNAILHRIVEHQIDKYCSMLGIVLFTVGSEAQSLATLASFSPPLTVWSCLIVSVFHREKSIRKVCRGKGHGEMTLMTESWIHIFLVLLMHINWTPNAHLADGCSQAVSLKTSPKASVLNFPLIL